MLNCTLKKTVKRKEGVEIKNKAEASVYEIEKQVKEWEGKVIDANDSAAMKSGVEGLEKLFAEAYQAAAAAGAGGAAGGMPQGFNPEDMAAAAGGAQEGSAGEDKGKVVDADFEVVDKDK
jgi:molecular chaperone DnaK